MCLIIHSENGSFDQDLIDQAMADNPDGLSVLNLRTGLIDRFLDYPHLLEIEELLNGDPFVIHCRYATKGAVNMKNVHPFSIGSRYWLFSNGTFPLGSKKICDTLAAAKVLKAIPPKHWKASLAFSDVRTLIYDKTTGQIRKSGKWVEWESGVEISKDIFVSYGYDISTTGKERGEEPYDFALDYKDWWEEKETDQEDCLAPDDLRASDISSLPGIGDYLAVYGTLRKGLGNSHLLGGAKRIGLGYTCKEYVMVDRGIPYVFEKERGGSKLEIEIYRPHSWNQWRDLDRLEGHPDHYVRKVIEVVSRENGKRYMAWIYFAQPKSVQYSPGEMKITDYKKQTNRDSRRKA